MKKEELEDRIAVWLGVLFFSVKILVLAPFLLVIMFVEMLRKK